MELFQFPAGSDFPFSPLVGPDSFPALNSGPLNVSPFSSNFHTMLDQLMYSSLNQEDQHSAAWFGEPEVRIRIQ